MFPISLWHILTGVRNPQNVTGDNQTYLEELNELPPELVEPELILAVDDTYDTFAPVKPEGWVEPVLPRLTEYEQMMLLLKSVILDDEEYDYPDDLPDSIKGIRPHFGYAPKEKGYKRKFPKAQLATFRFPGSWNGSTKDTSRLYCHVLIEPMLRQALRYCGLFGVLADIKQMGCMNHRHIQNNPSKPLSNHSWAMAVDQNTNPKYCGRNLNRALRRRKRWTRKITRADVRAGTHKARDVGKQTTCASVDQRSNYGPIPMPFSKEWLNVYDGGMSFLHVMAFKAAGFTWGGDWGRDTWISWVLKYGVGYDPKDLEESDSIEYKLALAEWQKVKYVDAMHWEAFKRRGDYFTQWLKQEDPEPV